MSGYESQNNHRTDFAANWVVGAQGASWSQRRRLMAVLRRTHRVLGLKRDKLGLGGLGTTSPSSLAESSASASDFAIERTGKTGLLTGVALAALTVVTVPQPALAQTALGNGTVTNAANCTNPVAGGQSVAIGCATSRRGRRN